MPFSQGMGLAAGAQAGFSLLGRSLCWEPLARVQVMTPQRYSPAPDLLARCSLRCIQAAERTGGQRVSQRQAPPVGYESHRSALESIFRSSTLWLILEISKYKRKLF